MSVGRTALVVDEPNSLRLCHQISDRHDQPVFPNQHAVARPFRAEYPGRHRSFRNLRSDGHDSGQRPFQIVRKFFLTRLRSLWYF